MKIIAYLPKLGCVHATYVYVANIVNVYVTFIHIMLALVSICVRSLVSLVWFNGNVFIHGPLNFFPSLIFGIDVLLTRFILIRLGPTCFISIRRWMSLSPFFFSQIFFQFPFYNAFRKGWVSVMCYHDWMTGIHRGLLKYLMIWIVVAVRCSLT